MSIPNLLWLAIGDFLMKLTEAEKGYLAGLIDGEGCINIAKNQGRYYVLQVITAQTNEYLLDYWHKKTGIGSLHLMKRSKSGENDSAKWHWHCANNQAKALLEIIRPYLVLKCEEARVALEYVKTCESQERQFRGKGHARLTADMLAVREMYKQTLHALKRQRAGAAIDRPLHVQYTLPKPAQMTLF
jgi:hypothetical protein